MKVLEAKAGALTNFEVLDLLRSRGATTDPLGAIGSVSQSECKVFEYLVQGAACDQTKEHINEFFKRSEKYNLAKAEKLNIINIRPYTIACAYPIIKECDKRLGNHIEELVAMVVEVLPPRPNPDQAECSIRNSKSEDA